MDNLIRTISSDGSVMACITDTTKGIANAEQIHLTSAVVTAALGRLMTAASMMGCMLKGHNDSLTLRIKGDGEISALIAVADGGGNGLPRQSSRRVAVKRQGQAGCWQGSWQRYSIRY